MDTFARLSCAQLKEMIAQSQPNIVDIRDERSFAAGHIPNSVHLDNTAIAHFLQDTDMDAPLIVCCYHGHSSQQASAYFIEQGFDEVYSLDGGFTEWAQLYPDDCRQLSAEGW